MDIVKFLRLPRYFRNIHRLYEIVRVLVKYGFGDLLERLHISPYLDITFEIFGRSVFQHSLANLTFEQRLRMACEELGPTFVKFAQTIATRPDIFPEKVTREFATLHDKVPPFSAKLARQIIEEELKKPLKDLCLEFSDIPLGSASISQVHAVRLIDGRQAVIKVQRPELQRIIDTDTEILRGLAALLEEHIPESRQFRPIKLVEEFNRVLIGEMNFTKEACYLKRFGEAFANEDLVIIPQVFEEYSTSRVLTQQFIAGRRVDRDLSHLLNAKERRNIVEALTKVFSVSIFEIGFFHGDPHPGNVLITEDKKIALLDYGAMGRLDESRQIQVLSFLISIFEQDLTTLIKVLQTSQLLPRKLDEIMLRNQIQDVLDRYLHRSLGNLNLAGLLTDVFEVVRYFGITPPPDLLLIARSLTACHHIGTLIDPTFEPLEALAPYLTKRYYQLIFSPRKYKKQLANLANDYYRLITDLPLDAHNLLHQLSREELTIYHKIRDSDGYLRHQNRMTNRWVMTFMGGILLMGGIFMEGPANTINSIRCILLLWGAVILFLVWRAVKKSGGT